MASVNLDMLKAVDPHVTINDLDPHVGPDYAFKYKDIKLDLEYNTVNSNLPDDTSQGTKDLMDLKDMNDIKQSIFNLFNTKPGQKLLNPAFGLDLSHYCFEPVTQITADHLARTILVEGPGQEPRITITQLKVVGDVESGTYNISFNLEIPDNDIEVRLVKGKINSDGFKFEQG